MEEITVLYFVVMIQLGIIVFMASFMAHNRVLKETYWEWIEGYREDVRFWKRLSKEYREELEEFKRQYNIKNGDTGDELVEE
jgi:t-SNARE complex subunit (syntaxin)